MKKLLFISAIGIASLATGQTAINTSDKYMLPMKRNQREAIFSEVPNVTYVKSNKKTAAPRTISKTVGIIDLGWEGNAFGTSQPLTHLWADPNLNMIGIIHRSEPVTTGDGTHGWLRYDYSTDGGATWKVDQGPAYKSNNGYVTPYANARYPQGALFSAPGTTVADSAFMVYFAPTLCSTNGTSTTGGWGGHAHGLIQVSDKLDKTRKQKEEASNRYLIPHGFTLTKTGVVYAVDGANDQTNTTTPVGYKDTMIISKGVWNAAKRDIDFTNSKLYVPCTKDNKNRTNYLGDVRITFADDGQTGYLSLMGHNSYTLTNGDSVNYLIVYKTTNGGTSWSGPTNISMDGVKPLLPNAVPFIPNRFTTGFEEDAVVDKNGNLHVILPISPTVSLYWGMSNRGGTWGMFDVYTTDGGTSWKAKLLDTPQTLSATFGVSASDATNPTLSMYNRGQASRTLNGNKLFFSWLDTDTNNYSGVGNMNPNLFVMGYDVVNNKWTNIISTAPTIAADVITWGCASYYVFGNSGTYTFPYVWGEQSASDPTKTGSPVLLHYLDQFTMTDADFNVTDNSVPLNLLLGTNEIRECQGVSVSQNFPNPFSNSTSFMLTLKKNTSVTVDVYNTMGQKVTGIDTKTYTAGEHTITIDGSSLSTGVYFYTVKTGDASVTQRMVVTK